MYCPAQRAEGLAPSTLPNTAARATPLLGRDNTRPVYGVTAQHLVRHCLDWESLT